jgi:hypothetical protein
MCFGGFHPAKNVEVPPTPVGGAPPLIAVRPLKDNESVFKACDSDDLEAIILGKGWTGGD